MSTRYIGTVSRFIIGAPATLDTVAAALEHYAVQGATLVPAVGFWKGAREDSVVVAIAGLLPLPAEALAAELARDFNQECVYLEREGRALLVYPNHAIKETTS